MSEMKRLLDDANPVIPVVTFQKGDDVLGLVECLANSGIETVEITLRTAQGLRAIESVRNHFPEVTVGVGTVLREDHLKSAVDVGAQFVVSPGFDLDLLSTANTEDVPYLPGVATVSEMMAVQKAGLSCAKLFPASVVGGVKLLKAVSSVLPDLNFCPTGGIGQDNYKEYLALSNVLCVGGSWICPESAVTDGDWALVLERAAELKRG